MLLVLIIQEKKNGKTLDINHRVTKIKESTKGAEFQEDIVKLSIELLIVWPLKRTSVVCTMGYNAFSKSYLLPSYHQTNIKEIAGMVCMMFRQLFVSLSSIAAGCL